MLIQESDLKKQKLDESRNVYDVNPLSYSSSHHLHHHSHHHPPAAGPLGLQEDRQGEPGRASGIMGNVVPLTHLS